MVILSGAAGDRNGIASGWSKNSRAASSAEEVFQGEDNEWLAVYAKEQLKQKHYDYFIFGHRHLPLQMDLGNGSRYINTGEWLNFNSYAVFDGTELSLKYFGKEE